MSMCPGVCKTVLMTFYMRHLDGLSQPCGIFIDNLLAKMSENAEINAVRYTLEYYSKFGYEIWTPHIGYNNFNIKFF